MDARSISTNVLVRSGLVDGIGPSDAYDTVDAVTRIMDRMSWEVTRWPNMTDPRTAVIVIAPVCAKMRTMLSVNLSTDEIANPERALLTTRLHVSVV